MPCPSCGAFSFMRLPDFDIDYEEYEAGGKKQYKIKKVLWCCPNCKEKHTERAMMAQEGKYIARNERALEKGVPLVSPQCVRFSVGRMEAHYAVLSGSKGNTGTRTDVHQYSAGRMLEAGHDAADDRGGNLRPARGIQRGSASGVLVLTMGVDTQDNRLEFEIIGWGREHENWRIMRGIIPGRPDDESRAVWKELDKLLERKFKRPDGKRMRILTTFVDSGGHCTDAVYRECARRTARRVFAIKGKGGEGEEYVKMSSEMKRKKGIMLFIVGVDSGKEKIAYSLNVKEAGPWYSPSPQRRKRDIRWAQFAACSRKKSRYTTGVAEIWLYG